MKPARHTFMAHVKLHWIIQDAQTSSPGKRCRGSRRPGKEENYERGNPSQVLPGNCHLQLRKYVRDRLHIQGDPRWNLLQVPFILYRHPEDGGGQGSYWQVQQKVRPGQQVRLNPESRRQGVSGRSPCALPLLLYKNLWSSGINLECSSAWG